MTHDDLIARGKKWLANSHNGKALGYYQPSMGVILAEFSCSAASIPDVIGFCSSMSVLIECKVSRSDLFADFKKSHRHHQNQIGNYRYYLVIPGIVSSTDIPDGWGLLVCQAKHIDVAKQAMMHDNAGVRQVEYWPLYSLARRAEIRGLIPELTKPLEVNL